MNISESWSPRKLNRKIRTLRGQTRHSVYTHEKCGVRPRIWGRTLPFRRSANGGSDPAIGAGVFRLTRRGKKADLTPHLGFDPAIGSPCKHGMYWPGCKHKTQFWNGMSVPHRSPCGGAGLHAVPVSFPQPAIKLIILSHHRDTPVYQRSHGFFGSASKSCCPFPFAFLHNITLTS